MYLKNVIPMLCTETSKHEKDIDTGTLEKGETITKCQNKYYYKIYWKL